MTFTRSLFALTLLASLSSFAAHDKITYNRMLLSLKDQLEPVAVIGLLEHIGANPSHIVLNRKDPDWTSIWANLQMQMLLSAKDFSQLKTALVAVCANDAVQLISAHEQQASSNMGPLLVRLQRVITHDQIKGVLTYFGFSKNQISDLVGPYQVRWMEFFNQISSYGLESNPVPFLATLRDAQAKVPGLGVLIAAIEQYLNSK